MIPVTKTFLPEFEDYTSLLRAVWAQRWVTNHGPLVTRLVSELKDYLGVRHLFFVSNGTIALQLAIRALDLNGEIATTPFSYVASTSSIVWERCSPRFIDIDSDTLCLDPTLIEHAITDKTQAILPVHVYGNCCNVERIAEIAKKHNLKVIYDGAHTFGARINGRAILQYGDISTVSFHATKLFHTGEGGAVITNDDEIAQKIFYLMNFGHNGPEAFTCVGLNAKNSELHAAMGLAILPRVSEIIAARKERSNLYDNLFEECLNGQLRRPTLAAGLEQNYSYYPLIFSSEELLLRVRDALNSESIFPRRYFYPSLTKLNYVEKQHAPVAEYISKRIMCLPLYHDLEPDTVARIVDITRKHLQ